MKPFLMPSVWSQGIDGERPRRWLTTLGLASGLALSASVLPAWA